MPDATTYDNAFKIQWELFLRHVALDEPFHMICAPAPKGSSWPRSVCNPGKNASGSICDLKFYAQSTLIKESPWNQAPYPPNREF